MRKVDVAVAIAIISMDMFHSMMYMTSNSQCASKSSEFWGNHSMFFHDCSKVQPWIIKTGTFIFAMKFVFGILALVGLALVHGNLIIPWTITEITVLTQKIVRAEFYTHFYPIETITYEYNPKTFFTIYMQAILEIIIELVAWFVVCYAHDDMYRKAYRKKKSHHKRKEVLQKNHPRVQLRSDAY